MTTMRFLTRHFRLFLVAAGPLAVAAGAPVCGAVSATHSSAAYGATQCCKVCRKGKACGNTCIAKNKACTKPRGGACNG